MVDVDVADEQPEPGGPGTARSPAPDEATSDVPRNLRFLVTPRWLAFHALVLTGIVVMMSLGSWQLRRLDERKEFNTVVSAQIARAPVELPALLGEPDFDAESAEWRQVTAAGTYLDDQIIVFNRSQDGRAGDNVLTPLATEDGTIVLVNRGFVPLGVDAPAPPTGAVEVLGRTRPSQERQRGGLTDAADGPITELRRVDIDVIAPQLPGEVAPVYLDLIAAEPAVSPGDPTPVPAPELDEGPHLSYAVQWFIFGACVAVGWALAVRRSIRTRRRADRRERRNADGDGVTDEGSDPARRVGLPSVDGATTTAPTRTPDASSS